MDIVINIRIASIGQYLDSYTLSFSSFSELIISLKKKIITVGISNAEDDRFCSIDGIQLNENNYLNFITDHSLHVLYNNIVTPFGAYEYDRVDGLVFFFHTAENSHQKYPHIHVRYSGEELSIYLLSHQIIGSFSNKKMMRKAIAYVEKNSSNLILEWNKLKCI